MFKPTSINVLSTEYPVTYVKSQMQVDEDGEKVLFGQVRFHKPSVCIYDNGNIGDAEVLSTLLEEVIHIVECKLNLKCFTGDTLHDDLARLSMGLADTFIRNGWWKTEVDGVDIPIGKAVYGGGNGI